MKKFNRVEKTDYGKGYTDNDLKNFLDMKVKTALYHPESSVDFSDVF